MRIFGKLLGGVAFFAAVIAVVYAVFSGEPAGTTLLLVSIAIGAFPAVMLLYWTRRGPVPPSDRPDAVPADGVGPVATFPGTSVWPIVMAGGAVMAGIGLVFGPWTTLPGLLLLGVAFVGATVESRG